MTRWRLVLISFYLSPLLFAPVKAHAQTFEEVCKYDGLFCGRLRDDAGRPVEPLPEVVAVLQQFSPEIKSITSQYGIDRRALIGAIVTENSLNVTKDRTAVKAFLYAHNLQGLWALKTGSLPSLGLGQIKPTVALAVEDRVAKVQGRKPRTLEEIETALNNSVESLHYASAIMRNAQDIYKSRGLDISKDPGLLATVYNVGNPEDHADAAKRENRKPKVNFFGFYVNEQLKKIEEIDAFVPPAKTDPPPPGRTKTMVKGQVDVLPFPPDCNPDNLAASHEYTRDATFSRPAPNGKAGGFYSKINIDVDCDMQPWSLISAANGATGWIKDDELAAKTAWMPPTPIACTKGAEESCYKQISDTLKITSAIERDPSGTTLLKLNSRDPNKPIDFKKWSVACIQGDTGRFNNARSRAGFKSTNSGQIIDKAELERISKLLTEKKSALVKQVGQAAVDSPSNPFQNVFSTLSTSGTCGGYGVSCSVNKELLQEFLNADLSKGFASYKDRKELAEKFQPLVQYKSLYDSNAVLKDIVDEVDRACGGLLNEEPKLQHTWSNFKKEKAAEISDPLYEIERSYGLPLLATCVAIKRLDEKPGTECVECRNSVFHSEIDAQINQTFGPTLAEILKNKEDRQLALYSELQKFLGEPKLNKKSGYDFEAHDCNYDPFEFSKDVDKLRGLACVEAVMVPDTAIAKKYVSQNVKNVLHATFERQDQYGIKIRGACAAK